MDKNSIIRYKTSFDDIAQYIEISRATMASK